MYLCNKKMSIVFLEASEDEILHDTGRITAEFA